MKQEEYIKTIVFNGKMFNIGFDDEGQCYLIEYLLGDQIVEETCPTYYHFEDYLEDKFGGCENCNHCLRLMHGLQVIGLTCNLTYENIPEGYIIPPCKKEKEKDNEQRNR